MLLSAGLIFQKPSSSTAPDEYFIDMFCFSEGSLPTGAGILDLPPPEPGAKCALGALSGQTDPSKTPAEVEGYLPAGKKLALVNWFVFYANSGTTPNVIPGDEVQQLIDNGYQPVITWEMMYASYARLDPVQPRLNKILDGTFDAYIDAFAGKVKTYSGTVIMRIFHEFEGDWYSWSLTENGKDPAKYIAAFRHVVNRFRAAGAGNVKWMWCVNAEPKPYASYNQVTSCYPGDDYVDIVATDIYNHPDLGTPGWKSFRYTMSESYYYLVKHYSHKPLYVCEVGSRERNMSEAEGSQGKAGWICQMNQDLRSYFSRVRALIFFSMIKEHDWRINSSPAAQQAFMDCIWDEDYFGGPVVLKESAVSAEFGVYPNPFSERVDILPGGFSDTGSICTLRVIDMSGRVVYAFETRQPPRSLDLGLLPGRSVYVIELRQGDYIQRQKLVKM
jgi:hypothetical protein